jgi:N-acyl homoserine lactone hydrolase
MNEYSIWVAEFMRLSQWPKAAQVYGAWDGELRTLPFSFAVLQGDGHVAMVDTGCDDGPYSQEMFAAGIERWTPVESILARLGLTCEDVETIILTHHHFDHLTNVAAFPNATVYIQRRDVQDFMDKLSAPKHMAWLRSALDPRTAGMLADIAADGRLNLLDGPAEIVGGLSVGTAFDTHTAGSQYVVVPCADGDRILSGDAVSVFENLAGTDGDGVLVPIGLSGGSQAQSLLVMDEMLARVDREVHRVIPFHDAALWDVFPSMEHDNGLHIAEVTIATGHQSRLPAV